MGLAGLAGYDLIYAAYSGPCMLGFYKRARKLSDLIVDSRHVRFIFPPAQAVLSIGHRLDGAADGSLVWLCQQFLPGGWKARRLRDILGGTGALVVTPPRHPQ
jgi:hypothetical protein